MSQTAQPMRSNKKTYRAWKEEKLYGRLEVYEDKTNDRSGTGLMVLR